MRIKKLSQLEGAKDLTQKTKEVPLDLWTELTTFLNQVADEREQDRDGPGSMPSSNSYGAQTLINRLGVERVKAPGVR